MEFDIDMTDLQARITAAIPEALDQGMEHIRAEAVALTPVETGRLAGSATVHLDVTTADPQASITYDGPYARYQHERLDLRHEHGQAKYLEQPLVTEADKALGIIADRISETL
jgi:hypothetical protein